MAVELFCAHSLYYGSHTHTTISITTALFSTIESPNSSDIESTSPDNKDSSDSWISEQFESKSPHQILGSPITYSDITIGVLKEDYQNENRVSVAPDSVKMLVDAGLNVVVESGGKFLIVCMSLYFVLVCVSFANLTLIPN